MAICEDCGKNMLATNGCTKARIKIDGVWFDRIKYTTVAGIRNCHDCGAASGNYHHFGCDMETCPRCNWQLIGCDCLEGTHEDPQLE